MLTQKSKPQNPQICGFFFNHKKKQFTLPYEITGVALSPEYMYFRMFLVFNERTKPHVPSVTGKEIWLGCDYALPEEPARLSATKGIYEFM